MNRSGKAGVKLLDRRQDASTLIVARKDLRDLRCGARTGTYGQRVASQEVAIKVEVERS